jgi:hypothetical protein
VGSLSFDLARQSTLLLVPVAIIVAILAYRRTVPRVSGAARRTLTILRGLGLLLLLFGLCEPVVVFTSEEVARPVVALLVDASRSMEIADAPAEGAPPVSRRAAATRLVTEGGLEQELSRRYTVVPYLFGQETVAGTDWSADIGPAADGTDLAGALAVGRQAGAVDAIVLLTDGVRTAGGDPVSAARGLGRPVFTVGFGDPSPQRDLAVASVLASEVVYSGVPSPVVANLRGLGFRGAEVEVLLREGDRVLARETVRFPEGSEVAEVRFVPALDGDGLHRLTVAMPSMQGEITTENNAQSVAVKVLHKKIEVLLFFGRPEFDLAFMRRALAADEGIRVDAWFTDARGVLRRAAGAKAPPAAGVTEETLFAYDLVVIGNPSATVFQSLSPQLLGRFLERREGALLLLAGDQGLQGVPEPLWPHLPVARAERGPSLLAGPVVSRLTLEGENHPLTRLLSDAEENRALWASLPPLSGIANVGRPRPDAQVLASGTPPGAAAGGSDASRPLLVLSRRAGGRVLLAAGRGLWRWEFLTWGAGRSGDAPARLWASAVRWLVSREEFKRIEVRPETPAFRRGERVRFFARVLDESYRPVEGAGLRVTLSRSDDPAFTREVALSASGTPGEYRGAVTNLAPGLYRYRGEASRAGLSLGADKGDFVVSERSPEFEQTAMDQEILRAIADVSGGRFLPASEYRSGALGIELPDRKREVRREIPLWNHPALYLAIVGLFVTEWFLRKRRDLP